MRFTIRDLLWLLTLAGALCAWYREHRLGALLAIQVDEARDQAHHWQFISDLYQPRADYGR